MTSVFDPMAARFNNPGHPYPYLCGAGLGHLWVGPRRNDFDPALIKTVQKHLEKFKLPHEPGDAINAIRNRILKGDWGWLEQREDEALAKPVVTVAEPETKPAMPKRLSEMSPEERAEHEAAIERAKENLRRANYAV